MSYFSWYEKVSSRPSPQLSGKKPVQGSSAHKDAEQDVASRKSLIVVLLPRTELWDFLSRPHSLRAVLPFELFAPNLRRSRANSSVLLRFSHN